MNEVYIEKLISLIKQGIIIVEDIKNIVYKEEVKRRIGL